MTETPHDPNQHGRQPADQPHHQPAQHHTEPLPYQQQPPPAVAYERATVPTPVVERKPGRKTFAASVVAASLLVGAYVLDFFDLSVPIVQVAGGLVVCSLAWSLLNQPDEPIEWVHEAAKPLSRPDLRTRAFYPLTMPLTVGPGSISVALTIGANQSQSVRSLIVNSAAHATGIFVVALFVFVVLRYADTIMRKLGPTGTAVLLRLSAFILLCIGVQITWNGASTLFRTLAFQ